MIISLLIRNFKIYQATNYIALGNGKRFSALVGENGAGKSSVLEALNSFFNNTDWNPHHSINKGYSEREPFICPIFLIDKKRIQKLDELQWFLDKTSEIAWEAVSSDFNAANKPHAELFCDHRATIQKEGFSKETHYLIPFGLKKTSKTAIPTPSFSIFESLPAFNSLITNYSKSSSAIELLHQRLLSYYKYIYLPADIDFKEYTKIEGQTIQALLGQKLETIVRDFIKKDAITEINGKLNAFLDQISIKLGEYVYKKPAQKQNLVNQSHLTQKVIEAYFESKVLNKQTGRETTPVGDLSSGEKRQALIDVAKAFLTSTPPPEHQDIILAIDEPELSLHVSSCFAQFEKLKDISNSGVQCIITTHWYGFMPIISDGVAIYCPKTEHSPQLVDLRCFREDIKKLRIDTKGELPIELELKGFNDLVQSIIASITGSRYRWVICEGSSDKIYLDHYLSKDIYVVPVGGSATVKKIFNYLGLALEDTRTDVKGRVFFLLDTDKKFESFAGKDSIEGIQIRRIKNNESTCKTDLLKTSDNDVFPATVIEDTLNPVTFIKALVSFSDDAKYGAAVKSIRLPLAPADEDWPSGLALNLAFTDRRQLEQIFEMEGFKVKFALRYCQLSDSTDRPDWINHIAEYLKPPEARRRSTKVPKQKG
nr:AAA family ATPase [Pseudomonas sp. Marseille-Q3773]